MTAARHPRDRLPPPLAAALALGLVAQVGQVVLLRELLMVYYGSEFSMGIILASWMAWVGVGGRLGGALAHRVRRPVAALAALSVAVVVVLPATIVVARVLRGFFDVLPGEHLSLPATVWSSVLVLAPGCVLLGVQFVLVSRVWRVRLAGAPGDRVAGATGTYVWEGAGHAVGGVLFSLVLVHLLGSIQLAVLVGVLLPAALLWLVRGRRRARRSPRSVAAVGVAAALGLAALLAVAGTVDDVAYRLQWRLLAPDQELVETRQSRYGLVAVGRRGGQYNFYQSGHLAFATGAPGAPAAVGDYELEESAAAVLAHFAMAQHPAPRRILLIGGGMRGVLREVARHPVEWVDYVELDPVLVDAALVRAPAGTLAALASPRVRLITMDGRRFVRSATGPYDLVLVDVPDPATAVLNRFYTVEFFRAVHRLLEPDGVLVTGIGATADLRARPLANRNATLYHTLDRVFDEVVAVGDRFAFFFASDAPGRISVDPAVLRARHRERGVQARAFPDAYFHTLLQDGPVRRLNWVLRHHGRSDDAHLAPPRSPPLFPATLAQQAADAEADSLPPVAVSRFINSDMRPVGYFHTVVLWHTLTRPGRAPVFDRLLAVRPGWLVPPLAAALLIQLLLRGVARPGRRPDAVFGLRAAIVTTGFSIMALQIALLFAFQSVYGFVYEMVGLIAALFMAGLALGAALAHRIVGDGAGRRALAAIQLMVAGYAVVAAVALPMVAAADSAAVTFVLFAALTFAGGVLNGAGFPVAVACCLRMGGSAERATGIVYGNELLGACAGALLAGVVVAPVLGVVACCLMAGALNATAWGLIVMGRRVSWATA